MAVSSHRPAASRRPPLRPLAPPPTRGRARWPYVLAVVLVVLVGGLVAGAVALATAHGSLVADASGLARIQVPMGGGDVQSVSVVSGPHSDPVAVERRGNVLWPLHKIGIGRRVEIDVIIKRPGWLGWLSGKTEHLHLSLITPTASLAQQYVTLAPGAPLRVGFREPVATVAYGLARRGLRPRPLSAPTSTVTLPRSAAAGSEWIAAAPRTWERAVPALVSWFPAGAQATAVAAPAPGSKIKPTTPITLTFSKPVAQALGHSMPPVLPITRGVWHQLNSHAIVFRPEDAGYGLGAHVTVALPSGVRLVGATPGAGGIVGRWTVPPGSTLRLQQILSLLGYLPFDFKYDGHGVGLSAAAQESAAIAPPRGRFDWRYPNVPGALHDMWAPGSDGELTRAAVMAFENDHGITADGVAGPVVWKSLIGAVVTGHRSSFGYTFVNVDKNAQRLTLWHSGKTVMTTPVNTGIAQAPTVSGTFAVYEHLRVTTMSGTNPDGSHYNDPGIQFVSYFNGGDALHAFTRAQYGFPQSLGCVEMALSPAGQVWPYTPIGTIVHVA